MYTCSSLTNDNPDNSPRPTRFSFQKECCGVLFRSELENKRYLKYQSGLGQATFRRIPVGSTTGGTLISFHAKGFPCLLVCEEMNPSTLMTNVEVEREHVLA